MSSDKAHESFTHPWTLDSAGRSGQFKIKYLKLSKTHVNFQYFNRSFAQYRSMLLPPASINSPVMQVRSNFTLAIDASEPDAVTDRSHVDAHIMPLDWGVQDAVSSAYGGAVTIDTQKAWWRGQRQVDGLDLGWFICVVAWRLIFFDAKVASGPSSKVACMCAAVIL